MSVRHGGLASTRDECELCGSTENIDHVRVKQAPGLHAICQGCSAMDIPAAKDPDERDGPETWEDEEE